MHEGWMYGHGDFLATTAALISIKEIQSYSNPSVYIIYNKEHSQQFEISPSNEFLSAVMI